MATQERHLQVINEALAELLILTKSLGEPAARSHQYVGGVVDNTICLLCSPANSIDKGGRFLLFSNLKNLESAIAAIHRSFYSSIFSVIELVLEQECANNQIKVEGRVKSWNKIKSEIANELSDAQLRKIEKLIPAKPTFGDYLEAVLQKSNIKEERKNVWRKYFIALSVVRNKASHGDSALNTKEMEKLKEGGFAALISQDNQLGINARNYNQICIHIINFFTELNITL